MAESLATIITDVVTGGTNSHATSAYAGNNYATDFVTQGVVGAIGLNAGSGGTGSFCVNADASPDMGVTVLAGVAYITATPSSQSSQVLRAFATANSTAYTINANSSGSTKYDWIYLQVSATNANVPDAAADNVTAIYTSRSTSNTSDTGTPPTYGLLLAVVTVANGASSITNSNISDKRFNASIGAQNGSLIVTQAATGDPAEIQAAGQDANINIDLVPKGTGVVQANGNPVWQYLGYAQNTAGVSGYTSVALVTGLTATVTIPTGATKTKITAYAPGLYNGTPGDNAAMSIWSGTVGSGTQLTFAYGVNYSAAASSATAIAVIPAVAGSATFNVGLTASSGTGVIQATSTGPAFILVECC